MIVNGSLRHHLRTDFDLLETTVTDNAEQVAAAVRRLEPSTLRKMNIGNYRERHCAEQFFDAAVRLRNPLKRAKEIDKIFKSAEVVLDAVLVCCAREAVTESMHNRLL